MLFIKWNLRNPSWNMFLMIPDYDDDDLMIMATVMTMTPIITVSSSENIMVGYELKPY